MKPKTIIEIVKRKRYNTDTALLLAGDDFWDGHNWERQGRNTFLYRTKKGLYFTAHLSSAPGETDSIKPQTLDEAVSWYEKLPRRRVEFSDAFPGVEIEEA